MVANSYKFTHIRSYKYKILILKEVNSKFSHSGTNKNTLPCTVGGSKDKKKKVYLTPSTSSTFNFESSPGTNSFSLVCFFELKTHGYRISYFIRIYSWVVMNISSDRNCISMLCWKQKRVLNHHDGKL